MGYTTEQALQAIRNKQMNDIINRLRMDQHKSCVKDVIVFGLPYRVMWDYRQKYSEGKADPMEIELSVFYPAPSYGIDYNSFEEAPRPWEVGTDDWKRLFTRFIVPYKEKIPKWNTFDIWGNTEHTQEETKERKEYYMGLIADYEQNMELYDTESHNKSLQDYGLYNLIPFQFGYMWRDTIVDEPRPPLHPQALQIMYKERELCYKQMEYMGENNPMYIKLDKINMLIEELEKGGKQ